jgi:hypothetical protein
MASKYIRLSSRKVDKIKTETSGKNGKNKTEIMKTNKKFKLLRINIENFCFK